MVSARDKQHAKFIDFVLRSSVFFACKNRASTLTFGARGFTQFFCPCKMNTTTSMISFNYKPRLTDKKPCLPLINLSRINKSRNFLIICQILQFQQTLLTYIKDKVWDFYFYVTNDWPSIPVCVHFPGMTLSVSRFFNTVCYKLFLHFYLFTTCQTLPWFNKKRTSINIFFVKQLWPNKKIDTQ